MNRISCLVCVVIVALAPASASTAQTSSKPAPNLPMRVRDAATGKECARADAASVSWVEHRADQRAAPHPVPRVDPVPHVEWTCMPGLPPAR